MRRAGVSFSVLPKETTSDPQSQPDKHQKDGKEQDKTELPTPKTVPTPTSPKTLDGQYLFPEVPPQGDSKMRDPPTRHSTDQKNERDETNRTNDQETALLEWLVQFGSPTK